MGVYTSNQTKKGWLTSILELGAWFGALTSGFVAESLSRKYAILINVAIFIIGVVVQSTAITSAGHNAILGGRFVTGMGVGSLSMVVPIYVAECAPPESRGLLIGIQQFAIEFGVMISLVKMMPSNSSSEEFLRWPRQTTSVDQTTQFHWHLVAVEPHKIRLVVAKSAVASDRIYLFIKFTLRSAATLMLHDHLAFDHLAEFHILWIISIFNARHGESVSAVTNLTSDDAKC